MATKANLVIDQGATWNSTVTLTDPDGNYIDLSSYTGAAQMRKHYTSSTATAFTVQLGGANGTITLSLSANATGNVSAGRYLYDVELTDSSGTISRVFEGSVTVNPNVTR
jgi:hypothetical protein